jgi:hypothetical protein
VLGSPSVPHDRADSVRVKRPDHQSVAGVRGRRTRGAGRRSGRRTPAASRDNRADWRRGRTPPSGAQDAAHPTRKSVRSVTTIRRIAPVQGMPSPVGGYVRSSPLRSGGWATPPPARPPNPPPALLPGGRDPGPADPFPPEQPGRLLSRPVALPRTAARTPAAPAPPGGRGQPRPTAGPPAPGRRRPPRRSAGTRRASSSPTARAGRRSPA